MNPNLDAIERRFAIFGMMFLTGIFRLASFYTSPDALNDTPPMSNPLDKVSSLLQQFLYITTLLLLLARGQSTVRAMIRDPTVWMLIIYTFLSFLWSDFPSLSKRKGITTIQTSYFGLYVASRFTMKQQLQMLAWVFGFIAVFSFVFTLAFPGSAIEAGANAGSWRGPFTQKNLLARFMVLGAIVCLLVALDKPKKPKIAWGSFGMCILMILLTGSKTALLLLIMILALLPLYKLLRYKDTLVIPILVLSTLIAGTLTIFVVEYWLDILAALGRDPTLSGRTNLWEIAIEKISERPWLGYGYLGFWLEGGEAEVIWKEEGYKPPHGHNGYINTAVDLGLVGLFLFLLIIFVTYARAIVWLKAGNSSIEFWPAFFIIFLLMYNITESTIIEFNSIFWALVVMVSLSMKRVKPRRTTMISPRDPVDSS